MDNEQNGKLDLYMNGRMELMNGFLFLLMLQMEKKVKIRMDKLGKRYPLASTF